MRSSYLNKVKVAVFPKDLKFSNNLNIAAMSIYRKNTKRTLWLFVLTQACKGCYRILKHLLFQNYKILLDFN